MERPSMGRNNTFKKRRHSYKAALAVEIRMRAIVAKVVVSKYLASCMHATKLVH
jgi:hypothetical protein